MTASSLDRSSAGVDRCFLFMLATATTLEAFSETTLSERTCWIPSPRRPHNEVAHGLQFSELEGHISFDQNMGKFHSFGI
ncbi:Hypothetical protein FKW44_017966 [Caligus rogercresseyi]|uniref:Uncharacterized protein n=1 Tax=Caligus rogercresseyi TaxID=217165 RepID=A0A7T8GTR0_CALRO|nr:Hypothetical protein FKW44_017966 [Caligus rogercresseyi]